LEAKKAKQDEQIIRYKKNKLHNNQQLENLKKMNDEARNEYSRATIKLTDM
jgi:hypothetical protein